MNNCNPYAIGRFVFASRKRKTQQQWASKALTGRAHCDRFADSTPSPFTIHYSLFTIYGLSILHVVGSVVSFASTRISVRKP